MRLWSFLMLVWLSAGIPPVDARAQQVDPDTLVLASYTDLFEAVAQNSVTLSATLSAAEAQAALIDAAGGLPDPGLMAGFSPFPVHTARGEQVFQLRVEQMLPWPGKRSLQRQMAELDAALGHEVSNRVLSDLTFDAIHAGLAIHHVEATMDQVEAFRQRLDRFEQVAISRYETGEGEQQSIWKLQLAIAAQDQRLLLLAEDREAAIRRIEQIVHRPVRIAPEAFSSDAPMTQDGDVSSLSAYRELEQSLERSRLSQEVTRLSDRPDIGVSATWMAMQESSIPASSDGRDAFALGVMLRLPLGRTQQRAREQHALLQEETIRLRMAAFESTWLASWSEQRERLEGQLARQHHLDERLLPVAQSMLASAFQSYASGAGSFLDLLDAERTAYDLRLQTVEISTRLNTTKWTLRRLAGYLETAASTASTR
jgi:outer membrane protein TolC